MNILGIDFEDWYHPELIKKNIKNEKHNPTVINGIDKILELLRKHDTLATFFVVGELLEIKPEIFDKIIENGHEIGFHTMYHDRLDSSGYKEKFHDEIKKFAELTTKLDANFFVIWGSKAEKEMADDIKTLSPNVQVMQKLSLDALMSLISQMNLVIGSDTGPTHMAWALNVASITLFGSTPGYRNTYITSINKIIESDSEVDPNKIDKSDYSINNIKVNDISKLAQKLLEVSK